MMLACKYEEIAPPEVRDFVHISANTYTRPEVLQMERTVLIELDYNLTVPTMWPFLMNLLRFEQSETINHGAEYLAEQTLVCGNMTAFLPSLQAAACVYLARRVLGTEPAWTPDFEEASKYFEIDLQEPAAVLDEYVKKVPKLRISAVRKKFSHSRYSCISRAFDVQGFRPQQ
ncbi:Cyclin-B1-1 [Diplonema papillatum]|nr:Cyclin-B1-1 [Diplonema papillatum]